MNFEPKEKNRSADVAILALFVCAGIAFAFSALEFISGKGVLQFLAMVFLCALVFIFVRYKLTYFRYVIRPAKRKSASLHHEDEEDDGSDGEMSLANAGDMPVTALPPGMLELVVERRQGNGQWTTECLIRLEDVCDVAVLPDEKDIFERLKGQNKRMAKYTYFRNLAVKDQTVILADSPAGKIMLYLETEEKMAKYLKAVAAYNRENRISE